MKRKFLFLLPILAMSLTSCNFSDFFSHSSIETSSYDGPTLSSLENELEPTKLKYSIEDITKHNAFNTPSINSHGDINVLVVPTWLKDSATQVSTTDKDKIKKDIETAYFGTSEDTGWESVSTYYKKASYGRVNMTGKVTDWFTPDTNARTISESGVDILVKKAANWYKENNNDIKQYDKNGDGYIDCLCLIYAFPNSYNNNDALWAYTYWLQESSLRNTSNPGPNTYFWASYDFMYSSGGGDNSHCEIDTHTYIHEMGHVFGLDDYYDYAASSSYTNSPAGGFSMQDCNVGDHDPLSKMMLGWTNVYAPTESCTINIHNFEESGDVIVLSSDFTGSPFDEYLIIELYTPNGLNEFDTKYRWGGNYSGYPKGINKFGIRIWHADARLLYITNNDQNFTESKVSNSIQNGRYYCFANSNTTYKSSTAGYCSEVAAFRNYNLLQLLRNSTTASYAKNTGHTTKNIVDTDMWYQGSTFTMSKYAKQFYKNGIFNNGSSMDFSIKFEIVNEDYATIKITK